LDDQRCSLPGTGATSSLFQAAKSSPSKAFLQETLKHPPPYPSVVLPPSGGYWIETPGKIDQKIVESNRKHFFHNHFLMLSDQIKVFVKKVD